jgi:O-antigen/teichoic acid export membrane protein
MFNKLKVFINATHIEATLAKGVLQAFLIQGIGAVLLLCMEVLAARILGVVQFGVFSIAMAWVYILSLFCTLGLNHALLKFVPIYIAHQEVGSLKGLLSRSNLWVGGISILIVLCSAVVVKVLFNERQDMVLVLTIAMLAVPFNALSSLRQSTLRGLGKISYALAPEFILRPLFFIFFITIATNYLAVQASIALLINLFVACLVFAIGGFWQSKNLSFTLKKILPVYHDKQWFSVAAPLLLIVGFSLLSSRIGVIFLGIFADEESVAIYTAASKVSDIIIFGLVSANAVVAPMIARLYATQEHNQLQKIVTSAAKGIALFTIPAALVLIFFGHEILSIFGQEFTIGYNALVILVSGQIVNALAGPVGYLMMMTGHQRKAVSIVAFSASINLILSGVLVPMFGVLGASIATAISIMVSNILMIRYVSLTLSIKSSLFSFGLK